MKSPSIVRETSSFNERSSTGRNVPYNNCFFFGSKMNEEEKRKRKGKRRRRMITSFSFFFFFFRDQAAREKYSRYFVRISPSRVLNLSTLSLIPGFNDPPADYLCKYYHSTWRRTSRRRTIFPRNFSTTGVPGSDGWPIQSSRGISKN